MKRTLAVLISLIAIILGALVAVPIIFGDKLISLAKEKANENLNAKLDFEDYDITVFKSFPDLTLVVNNLKITGVNEFAGVNLASISSFGITVDLKSVISGSTVIVKGLELDDADLNIVVLENGKANYDIVKPSTDTLTTTDTTELKIALKEYSLLGTNISYTDRSMGLSAEMKNLNHTGQGDFTSDLFNLITNTTADNISVAYGGFKYLNKVPLALVAELEMDMRNMRFTFKQNTISLSKLDLEIDGKIEMPEEDINFDLAMKAKKGDFKNLISLLPKAYTKDFEKIKVDGKLAINAKLKGIYNERTMPSFNINLLVENGSLKYPELPKSIENININALVVSPGGRDYDNTVVDVSKFHMDIAANPIDIYLNLKTPISDPEINTKILARIDLANLKDVLPMDNTNLTGKVNADVALKGKMSDLEAQRYEAFEASGGMELNNFLYKSDSLPKPINITNAVLRFSPKMLDLPNLTASFGQTKIQANGAITNYIAYALRGDTLKGNLYLRAGKVNLNDFMTNSPASTTSSVDTGLSVIKIPANINFELTSAIQELVYEKYLINDFSGKLILRDQSLRVEKANMRMFGGNAVMNGYYSSKASEPDFSMNIDVNRFDIKKTAAAVEMVQLLAPISKNATGVYSTQFEIKGKLDKNMNPIYKSLSGSGLAILSNVFFENFEPFNQLASQLKVSRLAKQRIADSKVQFDISEGKLVIKPFDTKFGPIGARIAGSTSITQEIDYVMNLIIPRKEFGEAANEIIDGLMAKAGSRGLDLSMSENIDVEVFITNTVSSPNIRTNLKEKGKSAIDAAKKRMEEEVNKKKEELENKVKQEGDKLKKEAEEKARQESERLKQEAEKATNAAKEKVNEETDKAKEDLKKGIKGIFGKKKGGG